MTMYVSIGPEMFNHVTIREHQDGDKLCVDLYHDGRLALLYLTYAQAGALAVRLAAYCQDKQQQAHPETCEDGSPVLQVDDEGPVTLGELTQAMRRGEAISDEEIVRRAGF